MPIFVIKFTLIFFVLFDKNFFIYIIILYIKNNDIMSLNWLKDKTPEIFNKVIKNWEMAQESVDSVANEDFYISEEFVKELIKILRVEKNNFTMSMIITILWLIEKVKNKNLEKLAIKENLEAIIKIQSDSLKFVFEEWEKKKMMAFGQISSITELEDKIEQLEYELYLKNNEIDDKNYKLYNKSISLSYLEKEIMKLMKIIVFLRGKYEEYKEHKKNVVDWDENEKDNVFVVEDQKINTPSCVIKWEKVKAEGYQFKEFENNSNLELPENDEILEEKLEHLMRENERLNAKSEKLEQENKKLNEENKRLNEENDNLAFEVKSLNEFLVKVRF